MISLTIDKDDFPFISSPKAANGENQPRDPKRAPNFFLSRLFRLWQFFRTPSAHSSIASAAGGSSKA